jgi:predicted amidohydrolase
VVLVFCDPFVYYKTGTANHIEIAEELMDSLSRQKLLHLPEFHYLWYFRYAKGLLLSGSATEQASDFERLQARAAVNPLKLLSALKNLS